MYGKKLRQLLKDKDVKQIDLAKALDIPTSSMSAWLNSDYPPLEFMEKVCEYLKYPLWRIIAPDDITLTDLSPKERDVISWFRRFNTDIQDGFVDLNRNILELLEKTLQTMRKKT